MKTTMLHTKRLVQALALAGLASAATPASAMDYYLRAEAVNVTMPDGNLVPMWGYALDGASCPAAPCAATVPGPALTVPVGDPNLNVHLANALTVPVSVVIPGQSAAMAPVKFTDASGRQRVRSLTAETAPGATATYSWSNLRPGTYLYHSGTHPQVQVQMGLYGTLAKDAAAGQPYTGVAAAAEKRLVFSEIDPALHTAVTAPGGYGPGTAMPSTLNYQPKYFLINGKPHQAGDAPIPLQAGQRTLLRLVNAGIQTRVPVINGLDMELVAEDGNAYPWAKHQYSALLPALKTLDAVVTPRLPAGAAMANHPLYDRRLGLTNPTGTDDGIFAKLVVANGISSPVMTSTPVTAATVGSAYSYPLTASDRGGGHHRAGDAAGHHPGLRRISVRPCRWGWSTRAPPVMRGWWWRASAPGRDHRIQGFKGRQQPYWCLAQGLALPSSATSSMSRPLIARHPGLDPAIDQARVRCPAWRGMGASPAWCGLPLMRRKCAWAGS